MMPCGLGGGREFGGEGHLCLMRHSSLLLGDAFQLELLHLRSHPTQDVTSQKWSMPLQSLVLSN